MPAGQCDPSPDSCLFDGDLHGGGMDFGGYW